MKPDTETLRAACKRALLENHAKATVDRFAKAACDPLWPLPPLTEDEAKILANIVWDEDFQHPRQFAHANIAIANELSDRIDALEEHLDLFDIENIKILLVFHMLFRRFIQMPRPVASRCYAALWLLQFAPYGTHLSGFLNIVETHFPTPETVSEG